MKVLQLSKYYPPRYGGIELVAQMLSRAHTDLGDEVDILAFGTSNYEYAGNYKEKVFQIKEHLFLLSTPLNFLLPFKFISFIKRHQPKKIYVHLPNPLMHLLVHLFSFFLKKKGIVVSAVYHSDLVNQKRLGPLYDWYFKMTAGVYTEIICSSDKLWKSSNVLSSLPLEKKRIVHFCADDLNQFKLRKHFQGNLLAMGRFVPYKGFEFLIRALNNTPYTLKITGDGPLFDKLKSLAAPNVHLLGRVTDEEKARLIDEADVLVVSSINRAEAYGMIIVEAFANGLPVIAADIQSGVTFLAADGERGETFAIESKEELLGKLDKLRSHPDLLATYSKNCRTFFEQNLSFDAFKKSVEKLDRA